MTFNLNLRPEVSAQLKEEAEARGMTVEEYLAQLIEEAVPVHRGGTALALLDAWDKEDATDDAEELQKRRREWASFKTAINQAHI